LLRTPQQIAEGIVPISSLVLHLCSDTPLVSELEQTLAADPRLTVGARVGSRLPLVLAAADRAETQAIFESISGHPGVVHVDVVFVEVDTPESINPFENDR